MLLGILNHEIPYYLRGDISIDKIKQQGKHIPKFNLRDPPPGPDHPDFDPEAYFAFIDGQVNDEK